MRGPRQTSAPRRRLVVIGIIALVCWAAHACEHLAYGRPDNLLWACNVATLLVALAAFASQPWASSIALCWLALGNPAWCIDIATRGGFTISAVLTHVGGLSVAIASARALGVVRKSWLWATVGLLVLQQLTRQLTPPWANVNVAFSVHPAAAALFTSHTAFVLSGSLFAAAYFLAVERLAARLLSPSAPPL